MRLLYNIYLVIPKDKIKYFYLLIFLSFFSSFLESIGISLIYPLLQIINNNPNEILSSSSSVLDSLNKISLFLYSQSYSKNKIIIIYISIIIFFFVLKFILQIALSFLFAKFLAGLFSEISNKFYNYYLEKPLSLSSNQDSAKSVNTILNKLSIVINDSLNALIYIISESFIFFFLLFLLFLINFKVLYLILVLILVVFCIFIFFKKISTLLGKKRLLHFSKTIQILQEGFSGLLEIKLFRIENKFLRKFNYHNTKRVESEKKFNFIASAQRIILENIFIIGFLCYLLFYASNEGIDKELLSLLGLYLTVLVRCLPSLNRITYNFTRVVNADYATKFVYSQLRLMNKVKKIDFINKNVNFKKLEFKNLFFKYPKESRYLFRKINFKIFKGDILGIVGKSGSGKTTFLKIILGLLHHEKGEIFFNNKNIEQNFNDLYSVTSYLSQNSYFTNDTVKENIILGSKKKFNRNHFLDSINLSNSRDLINKLPHKENTILGEKGMRLSHGQKQRICLARIFYLSPKFIILDEATSALDYNSEKIILDNLLILNKRYKTTIIIVSHRKSTQKICKRIINIRKYS